jgi:hypothetical protein
LPQISGGAYRLAAAAFLVFVVLKFVWMAVALMWVGVCVALFGMWSLRHPDGAWVQTDNGPLGDAVAGRRRSVQPVVAVIAGLLGVFFVAEGIHLAGGF